MTKHGAEKEELFFFFLSHVMSSLVMKKTIEQVLIEKEFIFVRV